MAHRTLHLWRLGAVTEIGAASPVPVVPAWAQSVCLTLAAASAAAVTQGNQPSTTGQTRPASPPARSCTIKWHKTRRSSQRTVQT